MLLKKFFQKVQTRPYSVYLFAAVTTVFVIGCLAAYTVFFFHTRTLSLNQQLVGSQTTAASLETKIASLEKQLTETSTELLTLKSQDQLKINQELTTKIKNIHDTFKSAVADYDQLMKLREETTKTQALDTNFTAALNFLSEQNYASASAQLVSLKKNLEKTRAALATASAAAVPANVATNNAAPAAGSQRQAVETSVGKFVVDIIAADLGSTRVVIETASSGDCADNCPLSSLADFVSKAGGYAGINGPYFCPAEYPSCAGKKNSFDTLLMNRQKTYFNSDNNVYSNVPAVIFSGGSARFVGASSEWGRDTGPDSVIAAQPMLLSGGQIRFGGDGDPKKGSRGSRSFIGTKGNTVYIGIVRSATVAEVAYVLQTLGLENALNLDSGGSVALMANGKYLAGPGRQTPFGIVFVRK